MMSNSVVKDQGLGFAGLGLSKFQDVILQCTSKPHSSF